MTEDADQISEMRPELDEALLGLDQLAQENAEEGLAMFATLPEPVQGLAAFQLVLARTQQALKQLDKAKTIAEQIVSADEENADAHHLLADILEDQENTQEANSHFIRTLRLDKKSYEEGASLPEAELKKALLQILKSTCAELPAEYQSPARIELFPTEKDVENGVDPRALSIWVTGDAPKGYLVLYAANLDAEFGDLVEFDEFAPHVCDTIRGEIAGHLSFSEEMLQKLGWEKSELPAGPQP